MGLRQRTCRFYQFKLFFVSNPSTHLSVQFVLLILFFLLCVSRPLLFLFYVCSVYLISFSSFCVFICHQCVESINFQLIKDKSHVTFGRKQKKTLPVWPKKKKKKKKKKKS